MKKLSLVVALLFVIQSVVTQAPRDGSEICLPGGLFDFLRFTIPENMKVLMTRETMNFCWVTQESQLPGSRWMSMDWQAEEQLQ